MESSILKSTKKMLGIALDDSSFDVDVLTHINGVFFTLSQLGLGPSVGFVIEDEDANWEDFVPVPANILSSIKVYVFVRTKVLFDPPETSYVLTSMENQIKELEWRINIAREETDWVDPDPDLDPEEVIVT